jgi:hypothetical protein
VKLTATESQLLAYFLQVPHGGYNMARDTLVRAGKINDDPADFDAAIICLETSGVLDTRGLVRRDDSIGGPVDLINPDKARALLGLRDSRSRLSALAV